jgi:hypothetical protein
MGAIAETIPTLRPFGKLRAQGEGLGEILMLSLSKHEGLQ